MTDSDLPNFDTWWDYQDPAATEAKFRGHLEVARAAGDPGYLAELLSQIARTQGLQQQFDAAHATLDEAEALLTDATDQARVRCHLERGRAVNSAGKPADSIPHFEKALAAAEAAGLEYYAVDAAHMLGIVHPEAIRWNEQALALAERATEVRARRWRGALYNNLGWTYHDLGRHADALDMFKKHLAVRTEEENTTQQKIARWSIAKMYRFLDRADEALTIQRELLAGEEDLGSASEGYTQEEIAECLLALGRTDEARPHFARAWELLHEDPWLARDEVDRLERLRALGGVTESAGAE